MRIFKERINAKKRASLTQPETTNIIEKFSVPIKIEDDEELLEIVFSSLLKAIENSEISTTTKNVTTSTTDVKLIKKKPLLMWVNKLISEKVVTSKSEENIVELLIKAEYILSLKTITERHSMTEESLPFEDQVIKRNSDIINKESYPTPSEVKSNTSYAITQSLTPFILNKRRNLSKKMIQKFFTISCTTIV